jgi:hypothetical protein
MELLTVLVVPDVNPLGTAALPWSSNRTVKGKAVALVTFWVMGFATRVAVLSTCAPAVQRIFKPVAGDD